MADLTNQVAVVTGASRGIGKGIAIALAQAGADVVINYRSHRDEGEVVSEQVQALGRQALLWQADVANREAVKAMVDGTINHFGRLDIAVANAGINLPSPVIDAKWEDVLRTIQVSQFGVFHTCQFAARQMVKQVDLGYSGGKILIISSIHQQLAVPGSAAYNMSKAAINHLGRTMALELAPYRINVNMINPGRIDTPSTRSFLDEDQLEKANVHIPWRRVGTIEEIGQAAVYLASQDADYITGTTLTIDGGFSINLDVSFDDL